MQAVIIWAIMRGKRVSDDLVRVIYDMKDKGTSDCAIARALLISRFAVQAALRRRVGASDQQRHVPLGRPRCTTQADDRAIVLGLKRNRFATQSSIAAIYQVSRQTVRRRGREKKMYSRLAVRDVLTKTHKISRQLWCRNHLHYNFLHWLFSDECSFELSDCSCPRRPRVHRQRDEKYSPCCLAEHPSNSRSRVMVWGCISSRGPGPLAFVDGIINSQSYIHTLRTHLVSYLEDLPLNTLRHVVFQQDNATPHTSAATRTFLQQSRIVVPFWPSLSPDLSPIENVWALMKRQIRKMRPNTVGKLRECITLAWHAVVTQALCQKLYSKMKLRLAGVLSKRGCR